ncbi:MAG: CBS domain-containing protein [Gemmatimonadaceae bacterium]
MQLRAIMQRRVVTIGPKEPASTAWTRMRRRDIRHLVVTDDSRPVGVLSERDLGGRRGTNLRKGRRVQDLVTPRVVSVEPETSLREAADLMRSRLIGSLPVVEGERLVGIVTATDVFDAIGREAVGPLSGAEQQLLRVPTSSKALGGSPIARVRPAGSRKAAGKRRPSQSEKREAFADRVPRPARRTAGRTSAPQVPANIRTTGVQLDRDARVYVRQRLGMKLGKFAPSIERVTIRVEDVNGPRGGVDQRTRVKVVLSGLPSIVIESRAASLTDSINGALTGAERAVRRALRRRRTRPLVSAKRKRARGT